MQVSELRASLLTSVTAHTAATQQARVHQEAAATATATLAAAQTRQAATEAELDRLQAVLHNQRAEAAAVQQQLATAQAAATSQRQRAERAEAERDRELVARDARAAELEQVRRTDKEGTNSAWLGAERVWRCDLVPSLVGLSFILSLAFCYPQQLVEAAEAMQRAATAANSTQQQAQAQLSALRRELAQSTDKCAVLQVRLGLVGGVSPPPFVVFYKRTGVVGFAGGRDQCLGWQGGCRRRGSGANSCLAGPPDSG